MFDLLISLAILLVSAVVCVVLGYLTGEVVSRFVAWFWGDK